MLCSHPREEEEGIDMIGLHYIVQREWREGRHEAISRRGSSEIATCDYNSTRNVEFQNESVIYL